MPGSTGSNHNISNRYHQTTMNDDLMPDEDEGLDRTTFDKIRDTSPHESGHSSSEDEYPIVSQKSQKKAQQAR